MGGWIEAKGSIAGRGIASAAGEPTGTTGTDGLEVAI